MKLVGGHYLIKWQSGGDASSGLSRAGKQSRDRLFFSLNARFFRRDFFALVTGCRNQYDCHLIVRAANTGAWEFRAGCSAPNRMFAPKKTVTPREEIFLHRLRSRLFPNTSDPRTFEPTHNNKSFLQVSRRSLERSFQRLAPVRRNQTGKCQKFGAARRLLYRATPV